MNEGNAKTPSVETKQIESELNRLESHITVLSETTLELNRRLSPVSLNEPPSTEKEKLGQELVPMAHRLRTFNDTIEGINNHINDIMQRLEL